MSRVDKEVEGDGEVVLYDAGKNFREFRKRVAQAFPTAITVVTMDKYFNYLEIGKKCGKKCSDAVKRFFENEEAGEADNELGVDEKDLAKLEECAIAWIKIARESVLQMYWDYCEVRMMILNLIEKGEKLKKINEGLSDEMERIEGRVQRLQKKVEKLQNNPHETEEKMLTDMKEEVDRIEDDLVILMNKIRKRIERLAESEARLQNKSSENRSWFNRKILASLASFGLGVAVFSNPATMPLGLIALGFGGFGAMSASIDLSASNFMRNHAEKLKDFGEDCKKVQDRGEEAKRKIATIGHDLSRIYQLRRAIRIQKTRNEIRRMEAKEKAKRILPEKRATYLTVAGGVALFAGSVGLWYWKKRGK